MDIILCRGYPYKSRRLELEKIIDKSYPYNTLAHTSDILSHDIEAIKLSDQYIGALSKETLSICPDLKVQDGYFVMEEGVLNDKEYQLGRLLIALEYNFAQSKPRIKVAGNVKKDNPFVSNSIRVYPLKGVNSIRFVRDYLKKASVDNSQYAYTGDYMIAAWQKRKATIVTNPSPQHLNTT